MRNLGCVLVYRYTKERNINECVTTPCMDMKTIGIPPCTGTPGQPRNLLVRFCCIDRLLTYTIHIFIIKLISTTYTQSIVLSVLVLRWLNMVLIILNKFYVIYRCKPRAHISNGLLCKHTLIMFLRNWFQNKIKLFSTF